MKNMRTTLGFAAAACALVAAPAGAADPGRFDLHSITITQTLLSEIVPNNSPICNDGHGHCETSYLRRFRLATDHGILSTFSVSSVSFAVESSISGTGSGQPFGIRLYTMPTAAPLVFASLTMVASTTFTVPDESLVAHTRSIACVVGSPTTQDLVVELFLPEGRAAGNLLHIGSNNAGEIRPSYVASVPWGFPEPVPLGDILYPFMHVLLSVTGSESSTPVAGESWGRLKTLYR